jgi:hypothetical protein
VINVFESDFGQLLSSRELESGLYECKWEKLSWGIVLDEDFTDKFTEVAIKKGYYKKDEETGRGFILFEKKKHILVMAYESETIRKVVGRSKENLLIEIQLDFQQYLLDLGKDIPHFIKKNFMIKSNETKKLAHWVKKDFDTQITEDHYFVIQPLHQFRVNVYLKDNKTFMDKFFPSFKKALLLGDITYKTDFFLMKEIVDIKMGTLPPLY